MTTDYAENESLDDDALQRCLEIARRDLGRAKQLDSMLEDQDWYEVARFAASCVQGHALRLKLWETPPCSESAVEDEPKPFDPAAQALLRKMLKAGLSRYEPDPIGALEMSYSLRM
jgi:hypothetical protein